MADKTKMSIKAKVLQSSFAAHHVGKEVEVVDFVATQQGLYALAIVELESCKEFALFSLNELVIEKK